MGPVVNPDELQERAKRQLAMADDRVDPVIVLSPVLLCGESEFDEMESKLRSVLGTIVE